MKLKTAAIQFAVILSLAFSPLAQAAGVSPAVDNFVNKYRDSKYAYVLSAEELDSAFTENALAGAYDAQIRHALEKAEGAKDSLSRMKEIEEDEKIDTEAFQIVDQMFRQKSIEQMNIDLLSIMHDYIFDQDARGPLSRIVSAIEQYNFSPEQMHEMKKQATALKQYTNGSLYGLGAITIGALLRSRGKAIWTRLARSTPEAKITATKIATTEADNEVEQMLKEFRKMRGAHPQNSSKSTAANILNMSSSVSKNKFYIRLADLTKKMTFRNFAYVTGATVVAGSANIGFNALNRIFFEEDITNTYINPADIKTDLYDGLAVLNLTCRSHDLLERVKLPASPNHRTSGLASLKELNALYAEYTILQKLAPQYLEKTYLPETISGDSTAGAVTMNLNINGHKISETVPCAKLKDAKMDADHRIDRIEVSLGEALYLMSESYLAISLRSTR